jgi:tRNA pseudouridine38-40 synthase
MPFIKLVLFLRQISVCQKKIFYRIDNLQKIGWSRAARTDKGVHAVGNFVNCKLSIPYKYMEDQESGQAEPLEKDKGEAIDKTKVNWKKVIEVINTNLPSDIQIHCNKN